MFTMTAQTVAVVKTRGLTHRLFYEWIDKA